MHHSAVVCCISVGFYPFFPFFNPQSNKFIKNNFFFKPSVTLYKFSLKFLDSIIFQSRHLFFFLLTLFFFKQNCCPWHERYGLFWLAANSAHLVRGKRLHIDYKAALLPSGPCGRNVSVVILTSDFSCLVRKEGQDRGLTPLVGQSRFQTCFLGWRDVE